MKKTRILIADDHALLRVGLKSMIAIEPDMAVVGEAENGLQAVEAALSLQPDVIIMDLMMPEIDGAEAARRILEKNPEAKIIILTSFGTAADLQRAISYGVSGIQLKEAPTEGVIKAIRAVMAGENAIDPQILSETSGEASPSLTDKQSEILQSVVRGLSNKDIAKQFAISEAGVKKHLRLIFAKIGAATRTEAVGIALRRHLLKT